MLKPRFNGRAGPADVVERVATIATELADDASRGNLLVPGHAIAEPQHGVRERGVLEEGLAGEPPARAHRRERAPAIGRSEAGRPVAAHREAEIVPLTVVVVGLAEVGQERGPPAAASDVLGRRIT